MFTAMEQEIRQLLDKFFDGQTSEAEEERLRGLMADDVPESLSAVKAMFGAFSRIDSTAETMADARVAEAVEHRMSRMVDQWSRVETSTRRDSRRRAIRWMAGIAASMLLIAGYSFYLGTTHEQAQTAAMPQDTYNDPRMAYKETEKALNMLSEKLNKGIDEMEKLKTN